MFNNNSNKRFLGKFINISQIDKNKIDEKDVKENNTINQNVNNIDYDESEIEQEKVKESRKYKVGERLRQKLLISDGKKKKKNK